MKRKQCLKGGGGETGYITGAMTWKLIMVYFDRQLLRMIREEILPHSAALPKDFMARVMALLNRGSIHSAADATFSGT